MERLGLGPQRCTERNPRIVFARMTGWGQDGPNASVAAHDINYIAAAGALAHLGLAGEPPSLPSTSSATESEACSSRWPSRRPC